MGKPRPVELRERAVWLVEQGSTHTEAARRLCVSIKFVNDMVRLKRETGSLAPKPQGDPGRGKLTGVKDLVERRIAARPDLTIDELTTELAAEHGVKVHRSSVGHWRTQAFIGALRHDRLDAPWVIHGAMNGEMFDLYVETQLLPPLRPGDVAILDNLSSHKSPGAAKAMRDIGAWFLFLPPYSPDLNPIEMAFSKLKALIRKAAARTCQELWKAVGHVCDLFTDEECYNFFKASGYKTD